MLEEVGVGGIVWKVLGTLAALVAAGAASRALNLGWKAATGNTPPTVPEDPETTWGEALAWAAVSGAGMGIARMFATRQAAQYYKRSTGHLPKAIRRDDEM